MKPSILTLPCQHTKQERKCFTKPPQELHQEVVWEPALAHALGLGFCIFSAFAKKFSQFAYSVCLGFSWLVRFMRRTRQQITMDPLGLSSRDLNNFGTGRMTTSRNQEPVSETSVKHRCATGRTNHGQFHRRDAWRDVPSLKHSWKNQLWPRPAKKN